MPSITSSIPEDQFAATLAHQLKTPAAAIEFSTTNLRRNLRGLLEDLASLAADGETAEQTFRFIASVLAQPAPPPLTGLLPEERLETVAARLDELGVGGDEKESASCLVRGGWDNHLEAIAPLLRQGPPLVLDVLETVARLRRNLGTLEIAQHRLRAVGSALRLLSQPVSGGLVDLRSSLEPVLELFHHTLPREIKLSARLEPGRAVRGQADLLAEVWSNLISNASQAVGDGGAIEVALAGCDGAEEVIRIIDDGPGIPPEALPRVFEPFFTTRASEGGTGLGLALARQIVERHGGRITVESRPGRTCFAVMLPAAGAIQGMEA